jgi:hypothetical protein
MQGVFGDDVFARGYAIVKQHRQSAFNADANTIREQLATLFPSETSKNDFIDLCLMQLIAEPMESAAFVTNLTPENMANLEPAEVEDL